MQIEFRESETIHKIREGDKALMSEFFRQGYRANELVALNTVRCCRNLIHISDIVKCNGRTLDEFVVSKTTEESTQYIFPREEPTGSDYRLWKEAINSLFHGTATLPYTLGGFCCPPHLPWIWFTTTTIFSEELYRVGENSLIPSYDIYRRSIGGASTRHGRR